MEPFLFLNAKLIMPIIGDAAVHDKKLKKMRGNKFI